MGAQGFAVEGPGPGPAMRKRLSGFVVTLRDAGFVIGQAEAQDAARLMSSPMAERPERLRAAMRTLFASRRTELARFDELFDAFWRGRGVKSAVKINAEALAARSPRRFQHDPGADDQRQEPTHIGEGAAPEGAPAHGGGRHGGASAQEAMSKKDIAAFVGERERAQAAELAERFARVMRTRLTRRERARRRGRRLDLKFRRRKIKPLRLVALLDASGSMESYVSFFTRFLHAVTLVFRESEAFLFHTRLAHVSSALRERDPARALDRLALMAAGVGGGTKIGECLAAFNRIHARRVIHSRTCVMILSDGYDTGPPELLSSAMRELRRRCKRVVWLNPLTGRNGFEPSARGMQAALPYLDLFAPAHSLESLAALEPYLARI